MAEIKGEGQGPFETVVGGDEHRVSLQGESGKTRVVARDKGFKSNLGEKTSAGRIIDHNEETGIYTVEGPDGRIRQTTKPRG